MLIANKAFTIIFLISDDRFRMIGLIGQMIGMIGQMIGFRILNVSSHNFFSETSYQLINVQVNMELAMITSYSLNVRSTID